MRDRERYTGREGEREREREKYKKLNQCQKSRYIFQIIYIKTLENKKSLLYKNMYLANVAKSFRIIMFVVRACYINQYCLILRNILSHCWFCRCWRSVFHQSRHERTREIHLSSIPRKNNGNRLC